MVLVTIGIVNALEDCKGIMNPQDIPCIVSSSWQFDCGSHTIKIYNSTPTLLDTRQPSDYGNTGRCNITFNFTETNSYLLNWSSGDSSKIIVEVDSEMQIAIVAGLGIFAIIFLVMAIILYAKSRESDKETQS